MSKIRKFIDKYFDLYLSECRTQNPLIGAEEYVHFPPTSEELEEIISYLTNHDVAPVIIGSIAVIKHMHVTSEDIRSRTYRIATNLELFVSDKLPPPPFFLAGQRGFQRTYFLGFPKRKLSGFF